MARADEQGIAGVLLGCLELLALPAPVLVAGDATGRIAAALGGGTGAAEPGATVWLRRSSRPDVAAAPWPAAGPFASAIVRLPKARLELEMMLHAVASAVVPGGPIVLYGANDEGIRSAARPLAALLDAVTTVVTRGHARVLGARRPAHIARLRPSLAEWRTVVEIDTGLGPRPFAAYPGLFAHARLDAGTRLLLAHLPPLPRRGAILDFGCGMGVIAAAVRARRPELEIALVDTDAVALSAARENVPGGEVRAFPSVNDMRRHWPRAKLDLILSNPPLHDGKAEDHAALTSLMRDAPKLLVSGGLLQIVVQRRVNAAARLRSAFGAVTTVARQGAFEVLSASCSRPRGSS
jgi:16S rRNA (guanine1207-N2)-methyltransferase